MRSAQAAALLKYRMPSAIPIARRPATSTVPPTGSLAERRTRGAAARICQAPGSRENEFVVLIRPESGCIAQINNARASLVRVGPQH